MSRIVSVLVSLLVACAPAAPGEPVSTPASGKADFAASRFDLTHVHADLEGDYLLLDTRITEGSADASRPVFSSSWWPGRNNGIAWRWAAGAVDPTDYDISAIRSIDELSPVEKYDVLLHHGGQIPLWADHTFAVGAVENEGGDFPAITAAGPATAWTLANRGHWRDNWPDGDAGYCNGWSAYATTEPLGAPSRDVRVRIEDDRIVECDDAARDDEDDGCVPFRMADIEALLISTYFNDSAVTIGSSCMDDEMAVGWDGDRPAHPYCRDVDPGMWHVLLTAFLARGVTDVWYGTRERIRRPLIVDHVFGPEIWNFPVIAFEDTTYGPYFGDAGDAASRVCEGCAPSDLFPSSADYFVEVSTTYVMASDDVAAGELLENAYERHIDEIPVPVRYLLALETTPGGHRIVGGQWLDESHAQHPDIVWISTGPRALNEYVDDTNVYYASSTPPHVKDDNPFVSYARPCALSECANRPESCRSFSLGAPEDNVCAASACGSTTLAGEVCDCDPCCHTRPNPESPTGYGTCCYPDGPSGSRSYVQQACSDSCWLD